MERIGTGGGLDRPVIGGLKRTRTGKGLEREGTAQELEQD